MKKIALIALVLASAGAMAQTAPGNTTTTKGDMAQIANPAKSGGVASDRAQMNVDARKDGSMGTSSTMGTSTSMGANGTMAKKSRWAAMDTNGDGMISKEEYNAYHAGRWAKMKQNNGMVAMPDMDAAMSESGGPN